MKKYLIICAATLWLAVNLSGQITDGIAAVVDGTPIVLSEVKNAVWETEQNLRKQYKGDELVEKVKAARLAALDELIERELLFRELKGRLDAAAIDEQIFDHIKRDYSSDRQAFWKTIQDSGMTETDFRRILEKDIIVNFKRFEFKREHEKELDDRLPLREQPLYRQWIEKLRSEWFVQVFAGNEKAAAKPLTVSEAKALLERIVIPECDIDADIFEVVRYLQAESQRLDAAGRGVEFSTAIMRGAVSADALPALPKVRLRLKNAPLTVILDEIQKQGAYGYWVRQGGVSVYSVSEEKQTVRERSFNNIEPEFFTTVMNEGSGSTDVTKEFAAKGVEFGENCNAQYFPREKKLYVHNTGEQMDKIVELLRLENVKRLAREKQ